MRVLIVSAFDPLPGDGKMLYRYPFVAKALLDLGHEVHYVSSAFFHGNKAFRDKSTSQEAFHSWLGNLPAELSLLPAKAYTRNIGLGRLRHHAHFARELKRFMDSSGPFDLIISAFPPIGANEAVRNFARDHHIPWILDIQDAWPQAFWSSLGGKRYGELLTLPLENRAKQLVRDATALFSVSKDYGTLFGREVLAFPLGISEETVPEKRVALPEIPVEGILLLYMGTSSRSPFVHELIKAWPSSPEHFYLVVCGSIKGASSGKRLWVQAAPPSRDLLKKAHIGLVTPDPNLYARLPNKVFGYLREGLILMSNIQGGELAEWIRELDLGATFDGTMADFWQKLATLTPTPENQQRTRAWAQENLTKEKVYHAYAEAALRVAELY